MRNLILLTGLLLTLGTAGFSQGFEKETWDAAPRLHEVPAALANESAFFILDKRRVEYSDDKEELVLYKTLHRIVRINDDRGIESFNRVYLPVSSTAELADFRARTILPDGKVIEIGKDQIKDYKDEDGDEYKIFAMEGLVKGCEIEFFYTYPLSVGFFGTETLQGRLPVQEARFELVAPVRLLFDVIAYPDAFAKAKDSLAGEKKWLTVQTGNLPGLEEEKYSMYRANLKRMEYKLSYNTARAKNERLFTWDELAKRIHNNYSTTSEKEMKRVADWLDDNKLRKGGDETATLAALENLIKTQFNTRDDMGGEEASNLEKILKTKLASSFGIVRLFSASLRQLEIPHEFVLAGDRNLFVVDRPFENWNNADNPLIYFPKTKKFLAPTLQQYRYPWVEPAWAGTPGLFCKTTTIGNFTSALGEVKPVPLEAYDQSALNTESECELTPGGDTLIIKSKQLYTGYAAATYRAIYNFTPEENQRLATKELIKAVTRSETLSDVKLENRDFESYTANKPFILAATVRSGDLVEKAGGNLIVRIGDLIGQQVEMYQDKPRQTPMEIEFPHILHRSIRFRIPDGYTVKNPDDLRIRHRYPAEGAPTMAFVSDYKINGDWIEVDILEEYRQLQYPLHLYEEFRKVINAAADFNKVVLVLQKK